VDTYEVDVCVVGGGPGGMTLALLLARSGIRVAVVERSRTFERDYRGEILQPGAMTLLDELGILGPARARGGYPLGRFQLIEHGRVLMNIDYAQLPKPFDFLLSIPQRHILEELLAACEKEATFTYLPGRSVSTLLTEGKRVTGVTAGSGENQVTVRASWVVAADGRYSKVRRLAGIEFDRMDVFEHDVLWFKIRQPGRSSHDVRVVRANGNPVLIFDSYPERVQIGWTLPHGRYREIAQQGFDAVKRQILPAVPEYADAIEEQITGIGDLSLLDVFGGYAREWVRDGLVLIGDCAHTHAPIGAQGINLAIQDAVIVHPMLVRAVRAGLTSASALEEYPRVRRPDIDRVMTLQIRQAKAMLSSSGRLGTAIRPVVAKLLAYTPLYAKILQQIAYGRPVRVATEYFQ